MIIRFKAMVQQNLYACQENNVIQDHPWRLDGGRWYLHNFVILRRNDLKLSMSD